MRIVLDTNVVVSAVLWRGTPYRLHEAIRQTSSVQLFTSGALLEELARVLVRTKVAGRLAIVGSSARQVVTDYAHAATMVSPSSTPPVVAADPADDKVIAAAVAARADLLITGDSDLLALRQYEGFRIVSPAETVRLVGR